MIIVTKLLTEHILPMSDILNYICFKDNEFTQIKNAGPTLLDFGFIHSDSTYDVVKISNRKLFLFDDHYSRFTNSTNFYNLKNYSKDKIIEIANILIEKNNIDNGFLWLISWRGIPIDGNPRNIDSCPTHFVAYVKPYYNFNKDNSSTVVLYKDHFRTPDFSFGQQYKNFSWIDLTLAQRYANSKNADTAIMMNHNYCITEGPGFGVGFVFDNEVRVPKNDVLKSITIKQVEKICLDKNISFKYTDINYQESFNSSEMFLASTSGGIIPVSNYEGINFKNNNIVKILQDEYKFQENSI